VPSCGVQQTDKAADILAALRPMPTKAEWEAEGLHQYGLIAVAEDGSAMQLEKASRTRTRTRTQTRRPDPEPGPGP